MTGEALCLSAVGAVLHLRGRGTLGTPQPLWNSEKTVMLLWNGEVYQGLEPQLQTEMDELKENDGVKILEQWMEIKKRKNFREEDVREMMWRIKGPFAFVLWDVEEQRVWFGRDKFGRRSLMMRFAKDEREIQLASVGVSSGEEEKFKKWEEVPTSGIFCFSYLQPKPALEFLTWKHIDREMETQEAEEKLQISPWLGIPEKAAFSRTSVHDGSDLEYSEVLEMFMVHLSNAVKRRVATIDCAPLEEHARVAVLFSGGIDSLVLAALADKHLPKEEPIDLVNVAFGADALQAPDRQTGINGLRILKELNCKRPWKLIEVNLCLEDIEKARQRILELIFPADSVMDFNISSILWHASKAKGVVYDGDYPEISSWVTRYSELNPSLHGDQTSMTGDTEKDRSISLNLSGSYHSYVSKAKVLISGLGADELLAGYGRHRTVFRKQGLQSLASELERDFNRIWRRNLGRDDRVISDHGREFRLPFLDEEFVQFVYQTPLKFLCDLTMDSGIGDKKILRDAARILGLGKFSSLQKRAIQFGTRIANKKVAGYVPLSSELQTFHIVNPLALDLDTRTIADSCPLPELLTKKVNKALNKPNFE